MASKHGPLYQRTPSPLSSSDEEDEDILDADGVNEEQKLNHRNLPSEESEEEDGEEEEEEEQESGEDVPISAVKKPSNQKPSLTQIPPKSKSSSEGESDSETESEKTIRSPSVSDFTVKPILSKPKDNSSKSKKPNSKPSAASGSVSKPGSKRPSLFEQSGKGKEEEKKRKVDEESGAVTVEEKKSHCLTRLWSEDDEIALLNGMLEYQSKEGADPYADLGAFHEFIKKSLHVDVSKNQLTDKIRRLKKKYQNNAEKGENGEDPVFSRPHEVKSFEISKKVWGPGPSSNGVDDNAKGTNGKATRKNGKVNSNSQPPLKDPKRRILLEDDTKVEGKADQEEFCSLYPHLKESLELRDPSLLSESGRNFMKENMKLIGNTNAKNLEEKWRNLQVKEVELFRKRMDLIQEQSGLVLNAISHSRS